MKQKIVIVASVFFILLLSGCTFGASKPTETGPQKFTFNKNIWKSSDGGKNWEAKDQSSTQPSTTDPEIISMTISPTDGSVIYVGLRAGGIMKTIDAGETWEFTKFKLNKVYGLAMDQSNPKTLYASVLSNEGRGKIVKTTDGGENWDEIYTFPTNGLLVVAIALDKRNPQIVFAATSDNQVIKSVDGGSSWKNIYQANAPVVRIVLDTANDNLVYLLAQGGNVLRSQDGGTNFETLAKNISDAKFSTNGYVVLETDPSHSGWVYLAGTQGIIRSKNAGNSWEKVVVLNDPKTAPVRALAINPKNSDEMIYGAAKATYKSVDGGNSWTTSQFNIDNVINLIMYNPIDQNIVYLGLANK